MAFNLVELDWGRWIPHPFKRDVPATAKKTEATEKKAPAAARKVKLGKSIGKMEPFFELNVNIPLLLEAMDTRVPEEKRDLRYKVAVASLRSYQLQRVQLFLYPDPVYSTSPVLLVHGSNRKSLGNLLSGKGPLKHYVKLMADGSYQLKKETFPEAENNKFPIEEYRIWLLEDRAVLAPKSLFQTGEQAEAALLKSRVARFGASTLTDQDLVLLGAAIPANIHEGWEKKIQQHPALEGNPQVTMIAGMGGGLMSQLTESFKQIESLALAFRFSGKKGRTLRYSQQFREEVDGAEIFRQLSTSKSEEMDADTMVMKMVRVVRDKRFDNKLQFKDNRLALEFNWAEKDDQAIFASLSEATIGHLFAQAMVMKPTEGEVETRHIEEPRLVASVDVNSLKPKIVSAFKQSLFPGHFWNFGDEPRMMLVCDTVDLPNMALAELTYEVLAVTSPQGSSVLRKGEDKFKQQIRPGAITPGDISLSVKKGTAKEALGKAKIRFKLTLPVALEMVEFKADEPQGSVKQSKGLKVKLGQLEKDVVKVTYRGGKSGRLIAYDKTGRALGSRGSTSSPTSMSTRFQGVIDRIKVVAVMDALEYPFELEVDLNGGEELKLAQKPAGSVRLRYDHRPIPTYTSLTAEDLSKLQVKWTEDGKHSWFDSLSVTLPKGPFSGNAHWEVHLFGKDSPVLLSGNSSWDSRSASFSFEKGHLKKANSAFGKVQLKLNTDIKRLSFAKKSTGAPVSQKLATGQKVSVAFDRNQISFNTGKTEVIQFMAYDARGNRLKHGPHNSTRDGKAVAYFWGQPTRFEIDVASRTIEKVIPFNINQRPVNQTAYRNFKKQTNTYRDVVKTLKAIGRARNRYYFAYGDDLAGLYYLYNKKGQPMRLIDKNVAHSDPAGKARFGYALKPYKGYYFTFLSGTEVNGVETKYKRQSKKKTFTWEKGTITASPFYQLPDLVAIPKDKLQPTFFLQWNQVYMKNLNGSKMEYRPRDYYNTGWVEAKYIGT
jgi:hypothetical protein